MTPHEFMNQLAELLDETQTGVLSTVDADGQPHVRWMSPAILKDRQGALFAVTCPSFSKTAHLKENPRVEWMFQTTKLDKVLKIRGKVNLLDNPSLKSEVLEALAPRLVMLWKASCSSSDMIVCETVVEEGVYYRPMSGERETITFEQ